MKGRNYYAADTVLLFVASFIDRSLSSVDRYESARMRRFYTEMVSELLFSRNAAA